jgi:anti-anti-sigma factor
MTMTSIRSFRTFDGSPLFEAQINIEPPGVTVVTLSGELDLGSAHELDAAITEGWGPPTPPVLVLDLTDVSFMSSTGLQALAQAHIHAAAHDSELRVTSGPRIVRRAIELMGMHKILNLYPSRATAVEALPYPRCPNRRIHSEVAPPTQTRSGVAGDGEFAPGLASARHNPGSPAQPCRRDRQKP